MKSLNQTFSAEAQFQNSCPVSTILAYRVINNPASIPPSLRFPSRSPESTAEDGKDRRAVATSIFRQ